MDGNQAYFLPEIRFGRPGVLKIHQISDDELSQLARGSGQSVLLNLALGILSIAASFLISLCTITIESDRTYAIFVIVVIVGFLAGIILSVLWWTTRQPIQTLVEIIRNRMPPEGESQGTGEIPLAQTGPEDSGDYQKG